jgi:hypothetical protein
VPCRVEAPHNRSVRKLRSQGGIFGKGHPVKEHRAKIRTPTTAEISAYMGSLAKARWKNYRERIASGEITAATYVYRPRGPMPPHSKAQQNLTRWERQIANAQLVRFALEGRKFSRQQLERVAETTLSRKRPRLHLRFGGRPPKHWHSVHYGRKKGG